jgi:DNA-binding transcriptional MerR regulator
VDFYTRKGLLHPVQNGRAHGYRRYTDEDLHRVNMIKSLQARKFSLLEIRGVLESCDGQEGVSPVQALEKVALELEKLQSEVEQARGKAILPLNTAMRALATDALQKATALSSILVAFLQDLPPV